MRCCINPYDAVKSEVKEELKRGVYKDEIMTALSMTQDVGATLQAILAKLEKLDSIESAVKKI